MIIIPFLNKEFVKRAFSELKIPLNYLDRSKKQTLQDFSLLANPDITYSPESCLIMIDEKSFDLLSSQKWLDFKSVAQIGWFSEDHHEVNYRLFSQLDPERFKKISTINPQLKFSYFEALIDTKKLLLSINILAGGLGLCYYKFRTEYDKFFTKFVVQNNKLYIPLNELDSKKDFAILAQFLNFSPGSAENIIQRIFPNSSSSAFPLFKLLNSSFHYLVANSFNFDKYFLFL